MKKENNRSFWVLSSCVTGIYCIFCFLSSGLVACGAREHDLHLFSVGTMLVPVWLFNPMGIVVALLGMRKNGHRIPFVINIVINIVCWFVAGMILVYFY